MHHYGIWTQVKDELNNFSAKSSCYRLMMDDESCVLLCDWAVADRACEMVSSLSIARCLACPLYYGCCCVAVVAWVVAAWWWLPAVTLPASDAVMHRTYGETKNEQVSSVCGCPKTHVV
jgi:hypothetical protein